MGPHDFYTAQNQVDCIDSNCLELYKVGTEWSVRMTLKMTIKEKMLVNQDKKNQLASPECDVITARNFGATVIYTSY